MPTLTLDQIAELCGARVDGDGSRQVRGPAGLAEAGPDEVAFLADRRYRGDLESTRAAGVLVGEDFEHSTGDLALLRCSDPGRAFSEVILAFQEPEVSIPAGVHPSAVVDPSAKLGEGVRIGPLCVVEEGAEIGAEVELRSRVHVGAHAKVGARSRLLPGVVLYPRVRIGEDCILHAGAVLGADGFGFQPTREGWEKTPQGGTVVLGDRVEVGANSAIDCARFGATHVEDGCKIDNLVHIAHNVRLGKDCLLIAQSGVAGSTQLGQQVVLAGQAGVSGHLKLGDGARIGGACKVFRDVEAGQDMWGYPAMPKDEAVRAYLALPKLARELKALKKRLADLEGESS